MMRPGRLRRQYNEGSDHQEGFRYRQRQAAGFLRHDDRRSPDEQEVRMIDSREELATGEPRVTRSIAVMTCVLLSGLVIACGGTPRSAATPAPFSVLRIGVGNVATDNPIVGLRQVAANQSFEGLIRYGADGRPRPWLAKSWTTASDQRSIRLELRSNAKFHDGSVASAAAIVDALRQALPQFLGSIFGDVEDITASSDNQSIVIAFKRPSPFLLESLEAPIKKPGAPNIGTGPFEVDAAGPANELKANEDYYLGAPTIRRIVVTTYPTTRAAWAEMLRNNIDMLYEVTGDEASSMQDATTVSTFTFTRPYQYMVLLNVKAPALRSAEVRRMLNLAVDRAAVVRDGFEGRASPSTGLVWPSNWAYAETGAKVAYDPVRAEGTFKKLPKPLHFTCLVPTDYERIALVVQRQLASVGVTMDVNAVAPAKAFQAIASGSFEAVLTDLVAGPGLLRSYLFWHTHGALNPGGMGTQQLDEAFDKIRSAASDDEYKAAVAAFQKLTIEDPPAIYLAWGHRSRAVSKRFEVPEGEPGRDVLATLRLWKPSTEPQTASRN
jgi:peptide/nickel transport system substrate-binding protein